MWTQVLLSQNSFSMGSWRRAACTQTRGAVDIPYRLETSPTDKVSLRQLNVSLSVKMFDTRMESQVHGEYKEPHFSLRPSPSHITPFVHPGAALPPLALPCHSDSEKAEDRTVRSTRSGSMLLKQRCNHVRREASRGSRSKTLRPGWNHWRCLKSM